MAMELPSVVPTRLLAWIDTFARSVMAARPRDQVIDRDDDPYIDRWYLARKAMVPGNSPRGHFADEVPLIPSELENLYLHRYARADHEEPHCHPWPNATLLVSGWYHEEIYFGGKVVDVRRRVPGDIVLRASGEVHAIVRCEPGTVSLFATMQKERDWGFHTDAGFVPWAEFRAWKATREGGVR